MTGPPFEPGRDAKALDPVILEPIVRAALAEDLGRAGDVTSAAVLPSGAATTARLVVREAGVVAGLDAAETAFRLVDPSLCLARMLDDGARSAAGETALTISGSARAILTAERVALNFAGRLSGVATLTRAFVDAVAHTPARVADTRKTTPGLRALEKRAVRLGGGINHRFGLDDAILIKDNHVAVAGGIAPALDAARAAAGHLMPIEIEVDTLDQLDEALAHGAARAILLDNMDLDTLREAVRRASSAAPRPVLEASGGVSLETVAEIAETGVDVISAGALTHSARTLDLGLDID